MKIYLWWHDTFDCPWVQSQFNKPADERPQLCTCVGFDYKPLPGRWLEFREVE